MRISITWTHAASLFLTGALLGTPGCSGGGGQPDGGHQDAQIDDADPACDMIGQQQPPQGAIGPEALTCLGAFRLPDGPERPQVFDYGGDAMTYWAPGDPAGPDDGHPGSLFVVGHPAAAVRRLGGRRRARQPGPGLLPARRRVGGGRVPDHCDGRQAVVFSGTKGTGQKFWYGWARWPTTPPTSACTCWSGSPTGPSPSSTCSLSNRRA